MIPGVHDLSVLMTFAGGLAGALVFGFLAHRLKLSPIVGYLLAGVLVGPFTPGFVADRAIAEQFAEIGVILLLFGIGLRFHLRELIAVWRVAVPGALIQSTMSTAALALLLRLLGWSWTSGIILGMAISVASTVVMALVLGERHDLHAPIGHIAIGWTVVEDLLTVAMLLAAADPLRSRTGAAAGPPAPRSAWPRSRSRAWSPSSSLLGRWVIPRALERIEKTRSRELFTLAVLVLAVGIAVGSAKIFGVSMALGAFLAGLAVGRSEFAARAAGDAVPMRDAFAVLFFVSVGMLFDPRSLVEAPLVIGVVLARRDHRQAARRPADRAPARPADGDGHPGRGGLLAGGRVQLHPRHGRPRPGPDQRRRLERPGGRVHHLDRPEPLHLSLGAPVVAVALRGRLAGAGRSPADRPEPLHPGRLRPGRQDRASAAGGARRGRHGDRPEPRHGPAAAARGVAAIYGDVLRAGTLDEAGIATAGSLILSADVEDAAEIIRQARLLNPGLRVLARCTHLRDAAALRRAGATVVAAGEAEVGVALAEAVTAGDDMDHGAAARHRDAVREHLYDTSADG